MRARLLIMENDPKPRFCIEKHEEIKFDSLGDGYRLFGYDISYPDSNVSGHIEIGYTKNPEGVNDQVLEQAKEDFPNLKEIPLAHLNIFRANGRGYEGRGADEEDMRQGRGTVLLEFAIEEAKRAGAVAMYVLHSGPYMEGFLDKHGFIAVGRHHCYKKLTE